MLMSSFILYRLSYRRFAFHAFEHGSFPLDYDLRAAIRDVGEADPCAGALQQTLRNEDAESHMLLIAAAAAPPGDIGLADARQHLLREARPVIDDVDRDRVLAPGGGDADLAPRELRRVLDEIAEAVHDLGAALHQRLLDRPRLGVASRRGGISDVDAVDAIRLAGGLDQRRERQAGEGRAALAVALARQVGQDGAAALAL